MTLIFFIYTAFTISLIEEIFFIIPSTLAQLSIGGLMLNSPLTVANIGIFILFLVIPAAAGVAIGSLPIFLITRYGSNLGINDDNSDKSATKKERASHLQKIISAIKENSSANQKASSALFFLMRLLPNFSGLVTTIIAGFWNFSIKNFLIITFFGSIIRIAIIGFVGWQASHYIYIFTGKYGWIGLTSSIILILILSTMMFYKKNHTTNITTP